MLKTFFQERKENKVLVCMVDSNSVLSEERGQFSYAFILVIIILGIIFLFVFMMPLMTGWMTSWNKASDKMVDISLRNANGLTDANLKAQFVQDIEGQIDASASSNMILTSMIQFSGLLIVILATLGLYLVAKRRTDSGMSLG
jgi:uncharacterized membrane protein YhaH (DUF805 family)